jgi:hypothetical protein
MSVPRGAAALALLTLALSAQTDGGAAALRALHERAAAVLRERDCQTALPGAGGTGLPQPDAAPRGDRYREPGRGGSGAIELPDGLAFSLAEPVLVVVVALGLALLLAAIVRGGRRAAPRPAPARAGHAAVRPPAVPPPAGELPDHARCAAAGDFAAAVHALLLQAFAHLARCTGALPVDATGRELLLLSRARAPVPATDDLAALVGIVELLHFGGRPAARAHYEDSLVHYERWRQACGAS